MSDTPVLSVCPECGAARDLAVFTTGWKCGSYERIKCADGTPIIHQSDRCEARHWERRALAAEAEVARLREMFKIAAGDLGEARVEKWLDGMTGTP